MDFAATVDMKNTDAVDWSNYPIQSGKFYETLGSLEPREVKKSQRFPIPDATLIVVLHKDHKVYYSEKYPIQSLKPEVLLALNFEP